MGWLPIHLASVADSDDQDDEVVVVNRVDDAVVTLANTVERLFGPLEFLRRPRTRLQSEPFDPVQNAFSDGVVELSEVAKRCLARSSAVRAASGNGMCASDGNARVQRVGIPWNRSPAFPQASTL